MDERLIAYVRTQRRAGFSDEQIAAAMRTQNYPESLVQNALRADTAQADPGLLRTYVQTYVQQGWSAERIVEQLQSQGFAEADIRGVLERPGRPRRRVSVLLIFPLLALLVLTGGYFFLASDSVVSESPVVSTAEPVRLSDIIENLLPLANQDQAAALTLCDTVVPSDRERCVLNVGRESSDPSLCGELVDSQLRDSCYLDFIYDGNYEFCPRLVLPSNIQYCNAVNA